MDDSTEDSAPLGTTPPGVVHVYQKYDPRLVPPPSQPPADLVSPAFEHMLRHGTGRKFTEEELANAIRLDPSQIRNLGPSIEHLREILKRKKEKILATHSTAEVVREAEAAVDSQARATHPPGELRKEFNKAVRERQLADLEDLWYRAGDERSPFASQMLNLMERLGEQYQVEELAAKYPFRGNEPMTVPEALEVKQTLEAIDKLLEQLDEAEKTARLAVIDMEELARFTEPEDVADLGRLQKEIQQLLKHLAEQQGLVEGASGGLDLTPRAYRLFQRKLLSKIFDKLRDSRSGRHPVPVEGDGVTETAATRPFEHGDSSAHLDLPGSFVNAMVRQGAPATRGLDRRDLVVHRTRKTPRCATVVLLDMSGSMRYDGLYMNVKRMGLALDGLIRSEFPGDYLQFVEMYSLAKPRHSSEIVSLMPRPVSLFDPVVRLRADLSRKDLDEDTIPAHFTNIQHGLSLARKFLAGQETPNRQVILITDGLPTAHLEKQFLYLLYPPDPRTEEATLREAGYCAREGVTINIFLLQSWNQTSEDVQFAYRLAKSTNGRVFFPSGKDLDRFVVWDYLSHRRSIIH